MSVKPVPEGYHTITAQLSIEGAAKAIDFYKSAFGAEVVDRATDAAGEKVMHCALRIGSSMIFVNDVFRDMDPGATESRSSMWLYVADVDAAWKRACDAGGVAKMPPMDMFWGDRMGQIADPFGQTWTIATHVKDMTPAEMKAAEDAFLAAMKSKG